MNDLRFFSVTEAATHYKKERGRLKRLIARIRREDDPQRRALLRPSEEQYQRLKGSGEKWQWTLAKPLLDEVYLSSPLPADLIAEADQDDPRDKIDQVKNNNKPGSLKRAAKEEHAVDQAGGLSTDALDAVVQAHNKTIEVLERELKQANTRLGEMDEHLKAAHMLMAAQETRLQMLPDYLAGLLVNKDYEQLNRHNQPLYRLSEAPRVLAASIKRKLLGKKAKSSIIDVTPTSVDQGGKVGSVDQQSPPADRVASFEAVLADQVAKVVSHAKVPPKGD